MPEPPDESSPTLAIERGETYDHETHGRVEVLGIWRGVKRIDEARNVDETGGLVIVCYTIEEEGEAIGELSSTLDEFLDAIEVDD